MNTKIFTRIVLGLLIYGLAMAAVVLYYPDSPEDMDWEDREQYNKVQIGKLTLGQTRQAILDLMGSPDISEAKKLAGQTYQIMFYRTQHMESDGITTMNECTPLLFVDDKLVAWGEGSYQQFLSP
ncbi:hypothetical protein HMF8227_02172 [Saliniradius amylolyticus]|uniref:Lipoprotein SmpA/OmlA domain-containing protein n=1 Tax=Saliniradius amylolyticus TaxID=2183582 RepID=A0A2S2E5W8_9ALTE|nr:DUF3192 domain-containing protein [Saliniradius amylolyticus]AWL12630.1 hypothetical protein HMF8227_02172 [Saliniradius amylolyticus]